MGVMGDSSESVTGYVCVLKGEFRGVTVLGLRMLTLESDDGSAECS